MSKISPDGFVKTDIFSDLSIFNFNNIYMGQYAAKINKGSNNLIIGNNAGKIGIGLNNSIFIGANAGSEYLDRNKVISIGDIQVSNNKIETESINIGYNIRNNSNGIVITNDQQHPQLFLNSNGLLDIGIFNRGITETSIGSYNSNLKGTVNIGSSNISTVNNSIVIGNSIRNDKFSLNIDNLLCKDDGGIYIGCGIYKDLPIILGSSSNNFTSNNLDMGNNFITSIFKIKNDTNTSISFITNTNQNIIYNLPLAPKYEYSFLSTDANGNLEWVELSKAVITDINTTAHIICNNLESAILTGDGSLITNINISNNNTDNLKEGINNLYLNIHSITKIFYSYIQSLTTDDIKNSNNYFSFDKYSSNFYSNLSNLITTDDIRSSRFYSSNDYYSNSSNYLLSLNTNVIKEGVSNLYYNPSNITTDFIKEGFSNLYYNEKLIKINISNTDFIKEGSSNLYFNQSLINSNIQFINTDFLKQGSSNLYATDYNIYNYLNSNLPSTDLIIQGTLNDYFCNINSQDKYPLISDFIREGSNVYYKSSNQITGIISFNTNTDTYKEGNSNLYYYENRGIVDFLKVINSNITTDNLSNGTNKKFIQNNFYNNNLQITGFLKANNVNNLDKENLRSNLEPKIGPLTEVYHVYDFERLSVVGHLSNIEIGYTADNSSDVKVPFIVIDNKVGINNTNPQYQLDVNGSIRCSNLFINNSNFDNNYYTKSEISNISNYLLDNTINNFYTRSQLSNISNDLLKNNSSYLNDNYYTRSQLSIISNDLLNNTIDNYYIKSQISDISNDILNNTVNNFYTRSQLSNISNELFKNNSINLNNFANYNLYFNNSNIGINNKTPLYNLDINSELNITSNIRHDNNIIIANSKINTEVLPLIWFKFDYSSNWLIDSINNKSLRIQYSGVDAITYDSTNYAIGSGSALINGGVNALLLSDGVDIINTINNNNGVSISFWMYAYDFNRASYYLRFYLSTSSGNYNIFMHGQNNYFNIDFQTPSGTYSIYNIYIGSLYVWNLITLIIQKNGRWKIYSNGVLINTFIPNQYFPSVFVTYSGNTMIIGNAYINIDDFRIYSGILTDLNITDLYNKKNIINSKYIISSDIFVTSNVLFDNLNKTWVVNDNSNIYNNNSGNIGIGTTKPTYKLHVLGDVGVSGTVTQGFSDIRLKNKIGIIDKPFSIINNLEGFYYTPNDLAVTFGFDSNNRNIGLNALDAEKVIPEVVSLAPFDINENKQSKSGENYLTISYEKLVPVLLEGLKELKKEVEYLKNELKYR